MTEVDLSPDNLLDNVRVNPGETCWRVDNMVEGVRKVYVVTADQTDSDRALNQVATLLGALKNGNARSFNSKPTAFYSRKDDKFERNINMENEFHKKIDRRCDQCGKYGASRICICSKVNYCDEKCQKEGEKDHSPVCENKTKRKDAVKSPCSVCGKETDRLCACRSVAYCSRECQSPDWKNHRKNCSVKKVSQTQESPSDR